MIISSKFALKEEDVIEEEHEMYLHSPINSAKGIFGLDDISTSLVKKMSSHKDISLVKRRTSGLAKIEEHSINVLEQSMVAKGFIVTEFINPLEPEKKLAFTSTRNFWIGVIFLILMVVPGACIAPVTINLSAKHPLVKASWRTQGNLILSIPIMIAVYYKNSDVMSYSRDMALPIIMGSA